jgi:uncharacterized membrane protein YqjE
MIDFITDGAVKVAASVADSMRNSPGLLAMVVLQGLTLAVVGWNVQQRQRDIAEERKQFAQERQLFIEQCVIPKAKGD